MARGRAAKFGQGLCVLGAMILCSEAEAGSVHRDMRDLSFTPVVERAATVDQRTIRYTLRYQKPAQGSGAYSAAFVAQVIEQATRELFRYLEQRQLPTGECSPDLRVDLYTIDFSALNDHSRFTDWGPENGVTDKSAFKVWALYDPMKYDRRISSIMLTDHGAWANEILLAHETSHYWYDRLCLGLAVGGGTEAFAQGFQAHYERYMAGRR